MHGLPANGAGRNGGASFDLPEQVRTLTSRSLSGLGDHAARLADVAAVIGRDLELGVLGRAAGLSEDQVADGVEELVRRRVLRELHGRFDFGHDRIREVAYGRLLEPRRVLLHRRVAEALEALHAGDLDLYCAIIGSHYRQASIWPEACEYQACAGFKALERGAGREALACFDYALQAVAQLPDTERWRELSVRVRLGANGAGKAFGDYGCGRPYLLGAERIVGSLPDRRWHGRVAVGLGSCLRAAGEIEQALHYGRRGFEVAREVGDEALESAARFVLAMSEQSAGNFRRSLEHLAALRTVDASRPDWDKAFVVEPQQAFPAMVRNWTMLNYVQVGDLAAGQRLIETWAREGTAQDDVFGTQALLFHISEGRLHNATGNFEAAVRAFEAALGLYREDCHGVFYISMTWPLGLAYVLAGRVEHGLAHLEKAEAAAKRAGSTAFMSMRRLFTGRALLEAGRIDEADWMARDALRLARKSAKSTSQAGALGLLGEIDRCRTPVPMAEMEEHVQEALKLAEPQGMRPLAARCHLRLAWLYATLGRAEHVRHQEAAEALLGQMDRPRSLDAAGVY